MYDREWERTFPFSEGYGAACDSNGKLFYYDRKGNLIETAENVYICEPTFHEGMALAGDENDNFGFIGKNGEWAIKPSGLYFMSEGFWNGRAVVRGKDVGVINKDGKVIIPLEYHCAEPTVDGFFISLTTIISVLMILKGIC